MTKEGAKLLLDRAFNDDGSASYTPVSRGWVGIGQFDPSIDDTDLTRSVPIKNNNVEVVDDCETADWSESADATADSLNSSSYVEGSNSLNLGKSGTSSTSFSYNKATTSVDFSGKTLFLFLYVTSLSDLASSGTAVRVKFGSDSSNFYYNDFSVSDLSTGWNALWVAQSSASVTGSPVVSACDYSEIEFFVDDASDTVASGDLRMDYWHVADSTDFAEEFTTGYPTSVSDSLQVEARFEILDTECNGFRLNGVAWKNTDSGTPTTVAIGKHLVVGKDSTEQVIEVLKLRLRFT